MFDLWVRDTEITALIAASAVLIILPLQLLLCFSAKKLFIRLLPVMFLAAAAVTFYVMAVTAKDWSALLYVILAIFSGVLLLFSGIGWGIWTIVKYRKDHTRIFTGDERDK